MVDFTAIYNRQALTSSLTADEHGHGTAMAQIILAVNSYADISPVCVLNAKNQAECCEVLAGSRLRSTRESSIAS